MQQTPGSLTKQLSKHSLQDLPNFGSLFRFDHRLKALEDKFSEFKQTNQFAKAISIILGIIDAYLANKMHEAVKTADEVKEQVKAQVSKILPKIEKTVNEQLKPEVLTHSSNKSKTSHAVTANLSELELKKILIDKMESNKSIHKSNEQKNLYKDKDEEPSAGSNRGSKRRKARKEPELTSVPKEKTPKSTGKSTEGSKSLHKSGGESAHAEEIIFRNQQDIFQKPLKPPTLDRDWDKTLPAAHGPVQPWLSTLAQKEDTHDSFNELLDTPLDFLAFVMNKLKVDNLTPELLAGPTFELMKGSCKSLVELEYFLEEVYKATTDQLDWNNPEGQQYPHDLCKPLPLIPNSQGRRVIPFDHFINNELAYLRSGTSIRTYATSVTKTKAADYGHIKWIEDLVPNTMWSPVPVIYDKYTLWGISHWGRKR
ncbi:hypothetical protein Tco_1099864, partial [Tanacetum coccineum]